MVVLKYLLLVVAIVYGFANIVKGVAIICGRRQNISWFQSLAMAVSIVGYIALEFHLGY